MPWEEESGFFEGFPEGGRLEITSETVLEMVLLINLELELSSREDEGGPEGHVFLGGCGGTVLWRRRMS